MVDDSTVFSEMYHDDLCPAKHKDEPCSCIVAYTLKLRERIFSIEARREAASYDKHLLETWLKKNHPEVWAKYFTWQPT